MAEGRAPISSSRIATGDIARHSFAVVRRGFDTDEVRAYLQSVARSIEALEEREQELRAALAEAEERAAHPVVDEATLTASLGQHSAQILRHAHEEAARIVAQAQEGAATLAARDAEPGGRAPGAHGGIGGRAGGRGRAARGQRRDRRRGSRASASSPTPWPRARRSSPRPRTRGGPCSSRCKRRAAACWPTWRRGGARSASRSSSCARPATRWRRRCTACATGWTGSWRHLDRTDEEARAAALAVGDQSRLHGADGGPHDQDALEATATRGRCRPSGRRRPHRAARSPDGDAGGRRGRRAGRQRPSVDELFARIRAGSDEAEPRGRPTAPARRRAGAATEALTADAGASRSAERRRGGAAGAVAEPKPRPTPGPDDDIIARRDELLGTGHGAAEPHGQARPGRRPEPAARPAAQRAVARGDELLGDEERAPGRLRRGGAGPSGRGVRRRRRRSAAPGRRPCPKATRSSRRRPGWPT